MYVCPNCGAPLVLLRTVTYQHSVDAATGQVSTATDKSTESVWVRCENSCGFNIDEIPVDNPRSIRKYYAPKEE